MKFLSFLIPLICVFILSSCNNSPKKIIATTNIDTIHFFSIKDFFLAEIKDVEATPYFIIQIHTKANGSKDSTSFKKEAFANFAQQFIACDVNTSSVKNQYIESAFKDNSTNSITLNYSTLNNELPIQNIDVLLNEETNKVTRIFIRKSVTNTDYSTTILYSWKANKSCMITTSIVKKNGTKYTEQQFVNWNDK
jgi:hypothetical protein